MTRDETIALFQACEAARAVILDSTTDAATAAAVTTWNVWAEKMLARKEKIIQANKWKLRTTTLGLAGETQETIDWLEDAHANFSGYKFENNADFRNFRFPGPASFGPVLSLENETVEGSTALRKKGQFFLGVFPPGGNVEFTGEALFADAEFFGPANFAGAKFNVLGDFRGATFHDDAAFYGSIFLQMGPDFSQARFAKTAGFDKANFKKDPRVLQYFSFAQFTETKFDGEAHFSRVRFDGLTHFLRAQFLKRANFDQAEFTEMANFNAAHFVGDAWFKGAKFKGVHFEDARFSGAAHFDGEAQFSGGARFSASKV